MKTYTVFHIDQCKRIKPKWEDKLLPRENNLDKEAEALVSGYLDRSGVKLQHVIGDQAAYYPGLDTVKLPFPEQFKDTSEYYSTLFHELTHSTGHPSRLSRFTVGGRSGNFGSEFYSKEELVAELGASMICNDLWIETDKNFKNSAAYIQSWLKALKDDKKLVISAAARVDDAVDLIYGKALKKAQDEQVEKQPEAVAMTKKPNTPKSFEERLKEAEKVCRSKPRDDFFKIFITKISCLLGGLFYIKK